MIRLRQMLSGKMNAKTLLSVDRWKHTGQSVVLLRSRLAVMQKTFAETISLKLTIQKRSQRLRQPDKDKKMTNM